MHKGNDASISRRCFSWLPAAPKSCIIIVSQITAQSCYFTDWLLQPLAQFHEDDEFAAAGHQSPCHRAYEAAAECSSHNRGSGCAHCSQASQICCSCYPGYQYQRIISVNVQR